MARALRIDGIVASPGGGFNVAFTTGEPPLPDEPSGNGLNFPTKAALAQFLSEANDSISDQQMMAFALASWFKGDTAMASLVGAKNKSATIDLSGAAVAVTLK